MIGQQNMVMDKNITREQIEALVKRCPKLTDSDGNDLYSPVICNWITDAAAALASLERREGWTGCGECDPVFQCFDGLSRCIRLERLEAKYFIFDSKQQDTGLSSPHHSPEEGQAPAGSGQKTEEK